MATILEFPQSDHVARGSENGSGHACEIIIFPGIRYERWEDAAPPSPEQEQPRKKSRAKKRDRMELPD